VHVTLRLAWGVWNLRSRRCFRAMRQCFADAAGRMGLRLVHFSVLGNHVHLIVEANDKEALSRGMQGLCIRLAKALNRVMGRSGPVFGDHYHSRLLRTPTEVVNAIAYVLDNHTHHYDGNAGRDPYSSAAVKDEVLEPRTWLLRIGWRRVRRAPQWVVRELSSERGRAIRGRLTAST
jgi:REP element-mobilizing transposase RayT